MSNPINPGGNACRVDLRDSAMPIWSVSVKNSIAYIFPGVFETATNPAGEYTSLIWVGGVGTAGYAPGDTADSPAKGLASFSILDTAGNALADLEKEPCTVQENDPAGMTLFFQVPDGIDESGEYIVALYIDTTNSTSLPITQRFRQEWTGRLWVKASLETF